MIYINVSGLFICLSFLKMSSEMSLDIQENDEIVLVIENKKIPIKKSVAKLSGLLKIMIENDSKETEIPIVNVKERIMRKVIVFMNYYNENPMNNISKPIKSTNMNELVSEWYSNFVNIDENNKNKLYELISAANYLDIKPLLDLTCAKIATMIKGKSLEEIRNVFNVRE